MKTQSGEYNSDNEGLVANANEPSIVKVTLPNGNGLCSGNIIGLKTVLTAAHCVKGATGRFEVRTEKGTFSTYDYDLINDGDVGTVSDVNDIAILRFSQDITAPQNILTIGTSVNAGERFKMVGFGCQYIDSRTGSGVRRSLTTSLYETDDEGFLTVRELYTLAIRGVTAGGTCFGDSGGAGLVFHGGKWVLVGDVHAGGQDGSYEVSYFTNLTRQDNRAWLEAKNDQYNLGLVFE